MNEGWIKLNRAICDSAVFSDSEVLQLWIWLLCNAAYEEHDVLYQGKVIHLKQGEVITGRKMLSEKLRTAESKVYRALTLLQELGNVGIKPNNKFSVVSIVNWAKYQDEKANLNNKTTAKRQQSNSKATAKQQQGNTTKERKERKEYKEGEEERAHTHAREGTPPPPSLDEIRSFVLSRGSAVEPTRFYNFYASRGWQGVADWKLKIEEWENNEFSHKDKERKERLDLYQGGCDSEDDHGFDLNDFFENIG